MEFFLIGTIIIILIYKTGLIQGTWEEYKNEKRLRSKMASYDVVMMFICSPFILLVISIIYIIDKNSNFIALIKILSILIIFIYILNKVGITKFISELINYREPPNGTRPVLQTIIIYTIILIVTLILALSININS